MTIKTYYQQKIYCCERASRAYLQKLACNFTGALTRF